MPPTIPSPSSNLTIPLLPLNPRTFAPFGTCVENPRDPSIAQPANQGSALRYSDITHLTSTYGNAPSRQPAKPVANLFVSSPRRLRANGAGDGRTHGFFDVKILERHPYTSQTFIPLNLAPGVTPTAYLVIVAPTLPSVPHSGSSEWPQGWAPPPDLSKVQAFLARGDQAVTYAAGTWHAPMVVLGESEVSFVVVQHMNGVGFEDCQEVCIGEKDSRLAVEVKGLDLGQGLWTRSRL